MLEICTHTENSNFNSGMLKYGAVKRNKNNKKLNDDDDDDDDDDDYGGDKNNDYIQQQHNNIQCRQSDPRFVLGSQTTWSNI